MKDLGKRMLTKDLSELAGNLRQKNLQVSGRRTSVCMHQIHWDALAEMCAKERMTINQLATALDCGRGELGLTEALRISVLNYFRSQAQRRRMGRDAALESRDPAHRSCVISNFDTRPSCPRVSAPVGRLGNSFPGDGPSGD